jgi:ABC-type multidrug transport system fused ATPase/permease subunit
MFVQTSIWLQLVVFNGWGMAQISWAFFTSVFINKAQTASIVGYGIAVYVMAIGQVLGQLIYIKPHWFPLVYHLIPTMSFLRCLQYVSAQCLSGVCFLHLGDYDAPEGQFAIVMLYMQTLMYAFLAWYLNQIVPQTYGVPKKWNFLCKRKQGGVSYDFDEIGDLENDRENHNVPVYDYDTSLEDADAKAERNIVYNMDKADYYKYPLIVKDLRKEFKAVGGRKVKVATKNFSLRVKKGEMLGFLGPNGAGKTTLISMLTGMYPATSGNAWIAGFDIRNQID